MIPLEAILSPLWMLGRLVLAPFRYYFRDRKELPSFTVNLDDTETEWESEAIDEWDLAFREAAGFLPAFSRLEVERLKVLSDAQRQSEVLRRDIVQGRVGLGSLSAVAANARFSVRDLHKVVKADAEKHLFSNDLDRYNDLLRAKGIEPESLGSIPL